VGLVLAVAAQAEQAPYEPATISMKLHDAGNGVYYVIGRTGVPDSDNQGFMSNAGFVVTEEGVVVYDALGTPSLGWKLLQKIRSVTDQPVKHVVVGHYHADHIYGLQAFVDHTDAQVWAQRSSEQYLEGPGAERRLQQRREALFPWVDKDTRVVAPDHTFQDGHTFEMGDKRLELVHVGPAHAPDDTMMIVHGAGVVFSGDILFDGRIPFIGDNVDTENWLAGLEKVAKLEPAPKLIVPGHGPASDDAGGAITFMRGYLNKLRDSMGRAVNNLTPFETAYRQTDWSQYEGLPAFEATHRRNAYHVYLELQSDGF
jgi:glyoxylase-like metal-dependent hydrolase (beta-lactamase superfamily II)